MVVFDEGGHGPQDTVEEGVEEEGHCRDIDFCEGMADVAQGFRRGGCLE